MRRGFRVRRLFRDKESDSRTPGRKGSMKMSADLRRSFSKAKPLGSLRFKATDDL